MSNQKSIRGEAARFDETSLLAAFSEYLDRCTEAKIFPNLAGFARHCRIGEEKFAALRRQFPEAVGFILAALEDEALNTDKAAAIVTPYLKHRLGYGEDVQGGQPEVIFIDRALVNDGE